MALSCKTIQQKLCEVTPGKILLWLYLSLAYGTYAFLTVFENRSTLWGFLALSVLIMIFAWAMVTGILAVINLFPPTKEKNWTWKKRLLVFLMFTAAYFAVCMIWYLAVHPGSINIDNFLQIQQSLGHKPYVDWHPAWHTYVFYQLPWEWWHQIYGGVFPQLVLFSIAMGWVCETIQEFSSKKWAWLTFVWIIFSPYVMPLMTYAFKDCGMAVAGCLAMTLMVRIYFQKKPSGFQWIQVILIGFLLMNVTMFRHNGILFSIPFLLVMLFIVSWKKWLAMLAVFALCTGLVRGPLYTFLGVESADRRVVETTGIPLNILTNAYVENKEALSDDIIELCESFERDGGDLEKYRIGNFNSIKTELNLSRVEDIGTIGMFKLALKAILQAPVASLKALISATQMVYGLEGNLIGIYSVRFDPNLTRYYNIPDPNQDNLQLFLGGLAKLTSRTRLNVFYYMGSSLLAMLAFILGRNRLNSKEGWKRIFLVLPIFIYCFGTMMVLTADSSRFFLILFLVAPQVILMMCKPYPETGKGQKSVPAKSDDQHTSSVSASEEDEARLWSFPESDDETGMNPDNLNPAEL